MFMRSESGVETTFLADQLPYEQNSIFLLSWFGTFLSSQPKYDWLEHRPLSKDAAVNRLLFLRLQNEHVASSQLLKRHIAPRALPTVATVKLERSQVALRCIKSGDSQEFLNFLVTAIPDGTIEINRLNISQWETFLPLSSSQLNGLYSLLYLTNFKTQTEIGCKINIEHGFVLRAGHQVFDLRALHEQGFLDNIGDANAISDMQGNILEFNNV